MDNRSSIKDVLMNNGIYVTTTSGVSMFPMLRDRKDTVEIVPCRDRLRKYDVALFERGDQYVLHRVIKILPDGYYIRGDNLKKGENVAQCQILGRLSAFTRNGKRYSKNSLAYLIYSRLTVFFHPLSHVIFEIYGKILRRVKRKNGK